MQHKACKQDLCIACIPEYPLVREVLAQTPIVVDLTVKSERPTPGWIKPWLRPPIQINNRQSIVPKTSPSQHHHFLRIRTAMSQYGYSSQHPLMQCMGRQIMGCHGCDAAHF